MASDVFGDYTVKIEAIYFSFGEIPSSIFIVDVVINDIYFTGTVHKDTELLMKDISYYKLSMENVFNNGKLRFFDFKLLTDQKNESVFYLFHSNLAKAEFFNFDLRLANVIIWSCFLIESTFVNVTWPERLNIPFRFMELSRFLDTKEMYRQLKYAYSKQGIQF